MKKNKAFTLIEIIVVIFLIALLGTWLAINFSQVRRTARDGKRIMDVSELQLALENYRSFEGRYPDILNPGQSLIGQNTGNLYLDQVPANPSYHNFFCSSADYNYIYNEIEDSYQISFCLEGAFENYDPGSKCALEGEIWEGPCFSCDPFVFDIDNNMRNLGIIGF